MSRWLQLWASIFFVGAGAGGWSTLLARPHDVTDTIGIAVTGALMILIGLWGLRHVARRPEHN